MKQRLVLLDFDGTLTGPDTLLVFIRYYHGTLKFLFGFALLSPLLVAMKLKILKNDSVKQIVLTWFFGKTPLPAFNARCERFAQEVIPGLIKSSAQNLLRAEQANKSRIIVISASPENWVKPWCIAQGIECLSTRLEVSNDLLTGQLAGENCYGPEKVARIKSHLAMESFDPIVAYGDSRGDREMLALATEPHYRALH